MVADLNIGSRYNLSTVDITGLNWKRSTKAPSGQSKTEVLLAPDLSTSGIVYAVTSGRESAFSYTTDGGVIWHQVGLIDTTLSNIS